MSYGNVWHSLDFNDKNSLSLLVGKNGAGKSSIKNVIEYGLYGKVTNKNLSDLPNRINQGLEVKITVKASNKEIFIHRGEAPKIFKVSVDGDSNFGEQVGKSAVQTSLEELYGIPLHIFNNIVSLSINDFKSFIKMKAEDKRKIIDKVFGLSIINQMRELSKVELKEIKRLNDSIYVKISSVKSEIESIEEQLEKLTNQINEDNENKKEELLENIKKMKTLYEKAEDKIDQLQDILNEQKANKIKADQNRNKIEKIIWNLDEKLELFNSDKCPTCGSDLTTTDFLNLKEEYSQERSKHILRSKEYQVAIKEMESEIDEYRDVYNKLKSKREQYHSSIKQFKFEFNQLDKKQNVETNSIDELKSKAIEKLENTRKEELKIKEELSFFNLVDVMLSENGIKKLAMQTILPTVNAQLKHLAKLLDVTYPIKFDENFDSHVYHMGEEISPATLSTGETKKSDVVVLIAIIKLMKIKFPGLNLLFLDEIFSGLDSDAIHAMVNILQDMSKDINLHIFVAHHITFDTNKFTKVIEINKNNGFSNLNTINIEQNLNI